MSARILLACVIVGIGAFTGAGAGSATDAPRLAFSTSSAVPGDTVEVRLRNSTRTVGAAIRLYLVSVQTARAVRGRFDPRLHFVGAFEPRRVTGRVFTVPPLEPGAYMLAYWCRGCLAAGRTIAIEASSRLQISAPEVDGCPATTPNGDAPFAVSRSTWSYHGNGHLAVLLQRNSPVIATNRLGGYKMLWVARIGVFDTLSVSYRRLDVPSPPTTATTVRGSLGGYNGPSWASRMSFEPGCWRIDARVLDVSLSFVADVVRGER